MAKPKIRAFHGTRHKFDKFDASKIGTGEGAQAYGHGLYFAENEGTAKYYRDKLSNVEEPVLAIGGKPIEGGHELGWDGVWLKGNQLYWPPEMSPRDVAIRLVKQAGWGDPANSSDAVWDVARDLAWNPEINKGVPPPPWDKSVLDAVNQLKSEGVQLVRPDRGHMYEVELDADPDSMIKWDRPFYGQSQTVQDAVKDIGAYGDRRLRRLANPAAPESAYRTGGWLYNNLINKSQEQFLTQAAEPRPYNDAKRLATDFVTTNLLSSGVPGIQYLDRSSRRRGAGTSNIVMFPGTEDLIRIIKRYGFIPPAMYAAMQGDNEAHAADHADLSLQPIEGKEGQFFLPNGVNANPLATPSPDEQRQIPIDNLPDAAMTNRRAMLDYDIEGERGRQSATKALIEAGVDPDVAELRATKIMEWARPTISAEAMRSVSPGYEGDAPVSPDAFLRQHLTNQAIGLMMEGKPTFDPQKAYQLAVRSVLGFAGNQDAAGDENSSAQQALQDTLDMIAQHAPEGEFSDKSGITEAELEMLKQAHGNHANFMYPDRLRQNFLAQRQHELLTAGMQGHEPSSGMSMALRAVGAPFDADTMAMHKQDMAALHGSMDPQAVTAKQAMYWWNRSKPNPNALGYDSYRDEQTNGSKYGKYSTTTPTGLIGGLGEDASRRYGAATQYMQPLGTDPSASHAARQFLADIRRDTKRPVPIIRPGLTPQETDEFGKIAKDYGTKSDAWLSADLAKDIGAYPTGFADTVLRSPSYMTDPASLADMALTATTGGIGGIRTAKTLIGKLAKGGASMVRPVTRNVGEESLQEGVTNTALTPAFGQTIKDFVFTPQQSNALAEDENGNQVDPMDTNRYRETVDRNWQNARSTLQENAERYRRKRNNRYGIGQ